MIYKTAVNRPITTLAFAITLLFFGLFSLDRMPASLYPDVEFPFVTIQTEFLGADPASVESRITDPIEEAISSIEGVDQITSVSAEGVSFVFVQFKLEKDPNESANDVRDKVASVELPFDAKKPKVAKLDLGATPVINLFVSTKEANQIELNWFVKEVLKPELQKISGVGNINLVGNSDRVVAIKTTAEKLAKYDTDPLILSQIIANANISQGGGRIVSSTDELIIKTVADSKSVEELKNLVISSGIRLSDVADVSIDLGEIRSFASFGADQGVMLEIQKISKTNTLEVIKEIKKALPKLTEKAGDKFQLNLLNDSSEHINNSLNNVKFDMVYGAILAVVIVFFFLRDMLATIVAAVSLPTSILGTFFLMNTMGFNLDMLTLLGLTLAIGVLIDDAIVVIENIYKHIESGKEKLQATLDGVKEIIFSLVSIAAVLLAVFIPVAFMDGIVGRFFFSFALTVSFGVVISFVVAITIIPALSSRSLSGKKSWFYYKLEPFFARIDEQYAKTLALVVRFKWTTIIVVALITVLSFGIAGKIGGEFLPIEDKSELDIFIKAPVGTSVENMSLITKEIESFVSSYDFVEFTTIKVGYNTNRDAHKANIYTRLSDPKTRLSQLEIMNLFRKSLSEKFPDQQISILQVPDIKAGESESPFMLLLSGDSFDLLESASEKTIELLKAKKGIVDIDTNYESGKPQIDLIVNHEEAKRVGILPESIAKAVLMAYSGEVPIGYFEESGKELDIVMRLADKERSAIDSLRKIQLKSSSGELINLDGLVEIRESIAPNAINRFDRQRQILITASMEDIVLGDALEFVRANLDQLLPSGISYRFLGEAEYMEDTQNAFGLAMLMMVIIIFLILASLFESLVQPVIIMIALPLSFVGAFLALFVTGSTFNLFVMIGIMMLMGLVGKNSILLIDMANSARSAGKSSTEAIIEAGEKRLRPILMTTFAIIFGMLPVALGVGAGSEGKSPMGITIIGGLISSMFLTLLAVPALYKIMFPLDEWFRRWYERSPQPRS